MDTSKEQSDTKRSSDPEAGAEKSPDRRDFLAKSGSVCAACALGGIPVTAGLAVLTDPLGQGKNGAEFLNVAPLDALPADGSPQKFTVRADKQDAWSRFPDQVIGAVYLRRLEEGEIQAFNVVCPHLGCAIDFRSSERDYFCPCHNSAFDLETGAQAPGSPSARPLDSLETKVDEEGNVWVKFQNFQMGKAEKIPV